MHHVVPPLSDAALHYLLELKHRQPPGLSDARFFQAVAPEMQQRFPNLGINPTVLACVWQKYKVATASATPAQARAGCAAAAFL
jgi:hypothetical protein